jgi:hypothetical protein
MYNVLPGVWFSVFSYASLNFKQLTTLALKDCSSIVDADLLPICEHCVSLQNLSLASLAGLVRPKMTSATLQILLIEDCAWFEELVGFIPCITEVSLIRLNCMHGACFDRTCIALGIIDEGNSASMLKSFIIKQCNGVTDLVIRNQCVEAIRVLSCGSLVKCAIVAVKATLLAISQCQILSSIHINAPLLDRFVIQDMKYLSKAEIICPIAEHVTFQDIHNTTSRALQQATKHFQAMKSCRMANIGAAAQFPFGSEFQCFKILTTMFISQCAFDDSSLDVLAQFEKLKQFELWDCIALTCPRFKFASTLKTFSCNRCLNLFSFDIVAPGMADFVMSKCHALKELSIQAVKLSNVTINLCEQILTFHIESNVLTVFDLENIHKIENFSCSFPALESVSIKHAHEPPHAATMAALFKSKNIASVTLEDLSGFSSFDRYQQQLQWSMVRNLNLQHLSLQDSACEFIQKMSGLVRLSIRHLLQSY